MFAEAPSEVVAQIEEFIGAPEFKHAVQVSWALRLLLDHAALVPESVIGEATRIAADPASEPFAVVAAIEFLADVDRLDHETIMTKWRTVPRALRPDLVAAAVRASRYANDWTEASLEGCGEDRVNEVVMHHLGYSGATAPAAPATTDVP